MRSVGNPPLDLQVALDGLERIKTQRLSWSADFLQACWVGMCEVLSTHYGYEESSDQDSRLQFG